MPRQAARGRFVAPAMSGSTTPTPGNRRWWWRWTTPPTARCSSPASTPACPSLRDRCAAQPQPSTSTAARCYPSWMPTPGHDRPASAPRLPAGCLGGRAGTGPVHHPRWPHLGADPRRVRGRRHQDRQPHSRVDCGETQRHQPWQAQHPAGPEVGGRAGGLLEAAGNVPMWWPRTTVRASWNSWV